MLEAFVQRVKNFFGTSRPAEQMVRTPVVIPKSVHGISRDQVAWQALRTCEALQSRGFKAYVVGGAVRDLLLGVTPKDFDVATDATPQEVKRCQRRAVIIGRRFRLVHVIFGREIIECSTFRALSGAGVRRDAEGRVLSDNVFGEMWEDAARRDFTINALYYDPKTEELYDYHHGFEDLSKRCLRIIGDPIERYREDPVRMLRAIRISAKLGFRIDRSTERPIPKLARLLENIPSARLVDELLKLLTCGHAVACIGRLHEEGLQKALSPLLHTVLSDPEGEKFFMLALKRTDERLSIGKKISPFFLFATLLWPLVLRRWRYNESQKGMSRLAAIHEASVEVLATECHQLSIQRRFQADMHDVWMLQAKLERRTGKAPFSTLQHPRYRAAYDFLRLRSQAGELPEALPDWWESFAESDEDARRTMVEAAQAEARSTAEAARQGRGKLAAEAGEKPRRRRPRRRRRRPSGASSGGNPS